MKEIKAYVNSDGVIFENRDECAKSENLVKCKLCSGTGNEKYIATRPYPSGLPDSGWQPDIKEERTRTCTRCNGIGYVTENIEDDLDYQQYLELKKRFDKI